MSFRIPKQAKEWLNRNKKINFTFEGEAFTAFEGDTISSALWAAEQKVLGRSFKYHRPRGILSLANHDINVMLTDGTDTNMRGDIVEVKDGMALYAVNTIGGVKKDKNSYIDSISPLLPVGFYYKAFHTPRRLFPCTNISKHCTMRLMPIMYRSQTMRMESTPAQVTNRRWMKEWS